MDVQMPIPGMGKSSGDQSFGSGAGADVPLLGGGQIDSDATAMGMQPSGVAGSYLGHRVRSEFVPRADHCRQRATRALFAAIDR